MQKFIYTQIAVFAVTAALSATSHAATDPRKCAVDDPSYCAKTAATLALRHEMAALTGIPVWTSQIKCAPTTSKLLVWRCNFGPGVGVGTVTFRALSAGWRVRVAVVCSNPATRPASSCHP